MNRSPWLSICVVTALQGCSREPQVAPAAAAAPAQESSAMDPAAGVDAADRADGPLVFSVKTEDGEGLKGEIRLVRASDQLEDYAEVPSSGVVALDKPCEPGERFRAIPAVAEFQQGKVEKCAARIDFVMYSVQRTFMIRDEGEQAVLAGNLIVAQDKLGFAADLLEYQQPEEAKRLRLLSTAAAGRLLGVDVPVVGEGTRQAASADFRQRVGTFQAENHLAVTGELDADTRGAISRLRLHGTDVVVGPVSEQVAVVPPEKEVNAAAAVTPPAGERMNAHDVLVQPVAPKEEAIMRANRARAVQKGAMQR